MTFKALRAPALTTEVAANLEILLKNLPGVENFDPNIDQQQFQITYDESQLRFDQLAYTMAKAGCPMNSIRAFVVG